VTIYECGSASGSDATQLLKHSGSLDASNVYYTSTTGFLKVTFTSDGSVTGSGFTGTWSVVGFCVRRLCRRQVRIRNSFNRLHQLRSGHVLGIDWRLNLPFMLGWIVFVLRFIEQLPAARRPRTQLAWRTVGCAYLWLPVMCSKRALLRCHEGLRPTWCRRRGTAGANAGGTSRTRSLPSASRVEPRRQAGGRAAGTARSHTPCRW
jgi:hypothetical protein